MGLGLGLVNFYKNNSRFASGTLARSYKVGEAIEVAFSILEDSVNVVRSETHMNESISP